MLKRLYIRNLAVIENVELSFGTGLTALTGETGAGKSILLDALGLALGDRADTSVIRSGCARAEISAMFDIAGNQALLQLLDEQSISSADNELLLRRTVNRDGPSRAYINATAAPLQLLRDASALLIDIHGQHDRQKLLQRNEQRTFLDELGDYADVAKRVNQTYQQWEQTNRELRTLSEPDGESGDRLSLLRYQVEELQALALEQNEVEALEHDYKRLTNMNSLLEAAQQALDGLYAGEQSANDRINAIKRELSALERFDSGLENVTGLLVSASLHLSEAADELRSYLDKLDQDPARLHQVEQRLDKLHDMARKHRVQPQALYSHQQALMQQLAGMEHTRTRLAELEQQQKQALEHYRAAADELGEGRRRCAAATATDISERIRTLGMPEGRFQIDVTPGADQNPHRNGNDQVEFLVSANAGQALLPLRKVASGGELSRISLALQVSANRDSGAATLIFDEVDAGISGGIAEIVGNLLHRLSADRQVLCVTHLPQVAAQGDNHLRVTKMSDQTTTATQVDALNDEERVEEIARMLGGVKITQQSRDHARQMLGKP